METTKWMENQKRLRPLITTPKNIPIKTLDNSVAIGKSQFGFIDLLLMESSDNDKENVNRIKVIIVKNLDSINTSEPSYSDHWFDSKVSVAKETPPPTDHFGSSDDKNTDENLKMCYH
jgi:hypothetical protein